MAAAAVSGGAAFVVAEGHYAGRPAMPACTQVARAVSDRLHQAGYAVTEAIDLPAIGLRGALSDFASHAAASRAPAVIYVCGAATAVDKRLFLLPADVDLDQPLRPETQGVVLRALLNAMAGTDGILVAELSVPKGTPPSPLLAAMHDNLPDGLHLAMTLGDGTPTGALGNRLAGDGTPLDQGWDRLAATLQGATPDGTATVALYDPPPAAAPPPVSPATGSAPGPIALAPAPSAPADPPAATPAEPDNQQPGKEPKSPRDRPAPDDRLRRIEAALSKRKIYKGPVDGVMDARVFQAITTYQLTIGDRPTGTLTQTEVVRLLNDW